MSYNKEQMATLLGRLSNHLAEHTGDFPGVSGAVLALSEAAKDPTKTPESVKVSTSKTKKKKVKPVTISYKGGNIIVQQVPFGRAHYAMNRIFGVLKEGVKHIAPGKAWDGDQVYKTCRDKKLKGYVLPIEKAPEVMAFFEEEGIAVSAS